MGSDKDNERKKENIEGVSVKSEIVKERAVKDRKSDSEKKNPDKNPDDNLINKEEDSLPNILAYITDKNSSDTNTDEESSELEEVILEKDIEEEKGIDELDEIRYHSAPSAENGDNVDYSPTSAGYKGMYDDNQVYESDDKERVLGPKEIYNKGIGDTKNPNEFDDKDILESTRVSSPHDTYRKGNTQ